MAHRPEYIQHTVFTTKLTNSPSGTIAKELQDEKAVMVVFQTEANGGIYAEEISYKPNYTFHTIDNVITMAEVAQVLNKSSEEMEQLMIKKALSHTKGNKSQAAQLLGIDNSTLWRKMKLKKHQ